MPRLKLLFSPPDRTPSEAWLSSWDPAVLLLPQTSAIPPGFQRAGRAGVWQLLFATSHRDFRFHAGENSGEIHLQADPFHLTLAAGGRRLQLEETSMSVPAISLDLPGLELLLPAERAHHPGTLLAADDGCREALVLEVGDDEYFDELRVQPFGTARRRPVSRAVQELFARGFLRPGMRVLDFGCGFGDDVRWLRRRGLGARGFDPWPACRADRWPTGSFDALLVQQVLEYIPFAKERVNALGQALAFLRPGALVYLSGLADTALAGRMRRRSLETFSDGCFTDPRRRVFQHGFATDELENLARECDIEALEPAFSLPGRRQLLGLWQPRPRGDRKERPELPVTWLDRERDLAPALTRLARGGRVGLDVETTVYQTPRRLCTVQIASDQEIVILDALRLRDLEPLGAFLADPDLVKIIHNARFEISVFRPYGFHIANVYDTMLASRRIHGPHMAGGHSLAACCRRELGYEIDKSYQTSVWTLRPLSRGQRDYAALDAEVLLALHEKLLAGNQHAGIFS